MFERYKVKFSQYKTKAVIATGSVVSGISTASAEGNSSIASIGPLIEDAATIMPSVLGFLIAVAGIVIAMAVIKFVVGMFDNILGALRLR